jgi:hypothetical protein
LEWEYLVYNSRKGEQNIKIFVMKKISLLIFAAMIFFVAARSISADDRSRRGSGFSITPFLREIELSDSHMEESFSVEIKNNSAFPAEVKLSVADFGSMDETGGVLILDYQSKATNKYGLASWLQLEKNMLSLEAGEEKSVIAKVKNDENLSPGGHYGVILADIESVYGGNDEEASNVTLNSRMTSLIFLRKAGGDILGLDLRKQEKESDSPYSLPKKIRLSFANTGNVHIVPRGIIRITDPFGREVSRGIINNESGIILPESLRVFPISLSSSGLAFFPGKYKLITQYRYDGLGDFDRIEEEFFIFPPADGIVFAFIFIVAALFGLRKFWKKEYVEKTRSKIAGLFLGMRSIYAKRKKTKHSGKAILSKVLSERKPIHVVLSKPLARFYGKFSRPFRKRRKNMKKNLSRHGSPAEEKIFWTPAGTVASKEPKKSALDRKKRKNRPINFSFSILVIVAIMGAIIIFYLYSEFFQGPVSGEIRVDPNAQTSNGPSPFERFEAIFLSFHYDQSYKVNFYETNIQENKNILERALLSQSGNEPKKIAFTVENMAQRNLDDIGDYNLRKKFPKKYAEGRFDLGEDLTGISFSLKAEDVFEKTYFIVHNNKLIEFSFSGPVDNENEIVGGAEDVMRSIQWKK